MKQLLTAWCILFLAGCARVPDPAAQCVNKTIAKRSGHEVSWDRKLPACKEDIILCLLSYELSVESAVQIALLNSPEIQALFEMIGIAQADLVNASLIANPIFGAAVRIPDQPYVLFNTEIDALQPIVNILLQPIRKKTASLALAETNAQVTHEMFSFIQQVCFSYYSLQAARANLDLQNQLLEVRELQYLLAKKQYEAGITYALDLNDYWDNYQHALLQYRSMQIDVNTLRQQLAHLMGVCDSEIHIACQAPVPETPLFCREDLLEFAFCQRLDLLAKRLKTDSIAASFGLYRWWAYSDFMAGIAYESEPDGSRKTGPGFALEVPLFNYGQGDRMRALAEFRQSYQMYLDLALQVSQDVNTAFKGVVVSKEKLDDLIDIILPNNQLIIDQTLRLYNFMNAGVYELLEFKAEEINTKMMIADTARDYLVFRANLTLAVGGGLP